MIKNKKLTDPEIYNKIKDYVITMLGAPVVQIELDECQLALAVSRICEIMDSVDNVSKWGDAFRLMVAQDGALSQAKLMLGRIRAKYGFVDTKGVRTKSKSGTNSHATRLVPLDGERLLVEGEKEYLAWQKIVFGNIDK